MTTRRKIELCITIILIIIALPFFVLGLLFHIPGHILTSMGYLAWGDVWSFKYVWLELKQDIIKIWNGR